MFSKKPKKPEPQQDAPAKVGDVIEVKYPKPKILVLDLEDEVTEQLAKSGRNVTKGTFGRPYKVGKSSSCMPVIVKFSAPNYSGFTTIQFRGIISHRYEDSGTNRNRSPQSFAARARAAP